MSSALLGFTGFVGGTLLRQKNFDDTFNSENIESIDGKKYELIVCAAAPGVKWLANKEPQKDWQSISRLMDYLRKVRAKQFVLISTVDVYPRPIHVDERTVIYPKENTAYGKHRFFLEKFVMEAFPSSLVVRLPGLFGEGLKKNVVFDFIHDNEVGKIHPQSQFQFYNTECLWNDIQKFFYADLSIVNMATEPLKVEEIYEAVFKRTLDNKMDTPPVVYDMHSVHADLFGGKDYMFDKHTILTEITDFIISQRNKR